MAAQSRYGDHRPRPAGSEQIAGVSDVKLTGRPEDAIAYNSCGAPRDTLEIGLVMTIVWLSAVTVKLRSTSGAGECVASPPCAARMVHVPTARSVAVLAFTMHTLKVSEEKVTGNPDDAVALMANGPVPNVRLFNAPNVI